MYTSYYDITVTQHDILRDLALYLSNRDNIIDRERLLMPQRETGLPKEWEKNSEKPFNARIVSIHTGIVIVINIDEAIYTFFAKLLT